MDEEVLNFTFAGCGFLGIYHVGVASCLREYAPDHMTKHLVAGASAGAMVAALLLVKAPLGMQCSEGYSFIWLISIWTIFLRVFGNETCVLCTHLNLAVFKSFILYILDEPYWL